MSDVIQDVRYGLRQLRRSPVLSSVAVISLAVGIAASTSMFSVYYGFIHAPLPYANQSDLQMFTLVNLTTTDTDESMPPGTYFDLIESVDAFEEIAAWRVASVTLTGGDEPVPARLVAATPNVFEVLGRQPDQGRGFSAADGRPGAAGVAVLTHDMWVTQFASDPNILGTTIELSGQSHVVVGIMPEDFDFVPGDVEVLVPSTFEDEREIRSGSRVVVVGTLKLGTTTEQAQAQLDIAWQRLAAEYPEENARLGLEIMPLREVFPGEADARLVEVMLAVALFVLLIAAANVANLLLARAEERNQEIAVRVSLGAKRTRILRQLLTESVLLGIIGGALGIMLSIYAVKGLSGVMPTEIPRAFLPQLQPMVMAFAVAISVAVGVFFGLAPALQALRTDQRASLGEGSRGGTVGKARKRLRSAFVVGEVAIALALLAGAVGLSAIADGMVNADLGFESEGLLTFRTGAAGEAYDADSEQARFHREIERELLALPQVTGIALMPELPRGQNMSTAALIIDGREVPEAGPPTTLWHAVNTNYFETMGIPLQTGRLFEDSDRADAVSVVVVNEAFADFHFPGEDPVGRRITIRDESREIVGVVANVFHTRVVLRGSLNGMAYLPMEQEPIRNVAYAIRTSGEPTALADDLRPAVWRVDPRAAVSQVQTLDTFIEREMAAVRALGLIMGGFGALALILSSMGIWGVMAHSIAQRTREIGIRMALGARSGQVMSLVLRNGLIQAGLGILLGTPLAFLVREASRGVAVDFQTSLGSPMLMVGIGALLAVVCVAASYFPARQALAVHPADALRDQ